MTRRGLLLFSFLLALVAGSLLPSPVRAQEIIRCTTTSAEPLIKTGQSVFYSADPTSSGNGNVIFFWSTGDLEGSGRNADGNIELFRSEPRFNADGTVTPSFTQVTTSTGSILGGFNLAPDVSADGSHLAFFSDRDYETGKNTDGNFEIFVADIAINANREISSISIRQITNTTQGANLYPTISDDGRWIAFISENALDKQNPAVQVPDAERNLEVFLADISPATPIAQRFRQVTQTPLGVLNDAPSLSGDGSVLVFSSNQSLSNPEGNLEIYRYVVDSKEMTPVTATPGGTNEMPVVDRDGSRVAFVSDQRLDSTVNVVGGRQVFLSPNLATGTGFSQISDVAGADNFDPNISADGNRVIYQRVDSTGQWVVLFDAVAQSRQVFRSSTNKTGAELGAPVLSDNGTNLFYEDEGGISAVECLRSDFGLVSATSDEYTAVAGEPVTYVWTLNNESDTIARNVQVQASLPVSFTLRSIEPAAACDQVTGACTFTELSANESETITATVDIAPAAPLGLQTATLSAFSLTTTDSEPSNNSLVFSTTVSAEANLGIVKSAFPESPLSLGLITYTLAISNAGPSLSRSVVVTDVLPADLLINNKLTLGDPNCRQVPAGSGTIRCEFAELEPDKPVEVTITAQVKALQSALGIALTNRAVVASTAISETDVFTNNNSDIITNTANIQFDLAVGASAPQSVVAGNPITFTYVVTNIGPSIADRVQLSVTLPAELQTAGVTPTIAGATGGNVGCKEHGVLSCDLNSLIANQVVTITVTGNITSTADGFISSDALVCSLSENTSTCAIGGGDTNQANDTSTTVTEIRKQAGITFRMFDTPDPVAAGTQLTYTLIVTNTGPSAAGDLLISDALPADVVLRSLDPSIPGVCASGAPISCTISSLLPGKSVVITATVEVVSSTLQSKISNTANVTCGACDPSNTPATVETSVFAESDLTLTMSANPSIPTSGQDDVEYTLRVFNIGPSLASTVILTNTLDPGLSFKGGSSGCAADLIDPLVVVCNLTSISVGMTQTVSIVASVDADATGTLNANAEVTSSGFDPNTPNQASVSVTARRRSALIMTKSVSSDNLNVGGLVTYTVIVTNTIPSVAAEIVISDALPVELILTQPVSTSLGTYNPTTKLWTWAGGELAPQQSVAMTVTGVLSTLASGRTIINTAEAAWKQDVVPFDQTTSATVLFPVPPAADLALTKRLVSGGGGNVRIGDVIQFELNIVNNGPAPATGIIVTDTIPVDDTLSPMLENIQILGCSVNGVGTGTGCYNVALHRWTVPNLAKNENATVLLSATVADTAAGKVINDPTDGLTANQYDPNVTNNTGEFSLVVSGADLQLTMAVSDPSPNAGDSIVYTIAVTNLGPTTASNIRITDTLPISFTSFVTQTSLGSFGPSAPGVAGVWTLNLLNVSATETLVITGVVASGTAGQTITNQIDAATSNLADGDITNNTPSVNFTVQSADLVVSKAVNKINPVEGDTDLRYTLSISNAGPNNATNVVVTDLLPNYIQLISAGSNYSVTTGAWTVGSVNVGAPPQTLVLIVQPELLTSGGRTITNTITGVQADQEDPNPAINASATITVVGTDLAVSKRVNDPNPTEGDTIVYTVIVTNTGPYSTANVVISDTLPSGLTFASANPSASYNSSTGAWTVGTLNNQQTATLTITATVNAVSASGVAITNTATITNTSIPDRNAKSGSDTASVQIVVNDAPAWSGTVSGQAITDKMTTKPFSTTVLSDADVAQTQLVTVTLDLAAKGTFTALNGFTNVGGGVYTFSGTATAATTALQALVFTPTPNRVAPGTTETTTFTLQANDGVASVRSNSATTVIVTSVNDPAVVNGALAGQPISDTQTISPFSTVTITDVDVPVQTQLVTVTLDLAAKGSFTGLNGFTNAGGGVYTFSGTAAAATTAIQGLVFTPTPNRVNPQLTETTTFTIAVNDSIAVTSNAVTTVVVTSVNDTPVLSGTVAGQTITDKQTTTPFSTTLISDADVAQTQLVTVTLDLAVKGTLSPLTLFTRVGSSNAYTFTGTAGAAQSAIRGLVFTPTPNRVAPGTTETTTFTVQVNDSFAPVLSNNATTVIVTSVNDAPVVAGAVTGQTITDIQTTSPFSTVTVTDVDNPAQTQLVTITLSAAGATGVLSTTTSGFTAVGGGVYTFSGTAITVTNVISGLVFTPTPNRVNPPLTETTTFTIAVNDSIAVVSNNGTTVVVTSVNDAPALSGTVAGQAITDKVTTRPLSTTQISDLDAAQTQLVTVTLSAAGATGSFTTLAGFTNAGSGVYTLSGTAVTVTTALQGLVFTPTPNRVAPDATETTTFTVQVNDSIAAPVSDSGTTVVVTSVNDAPVVAGAVTGQTITDIQTTNPFSTVTVTDVDNPAQTQLVTVTLDLAAKGSFTGLSGFTNAGSGVYTFSGTAVTVTTAIQGLVFTPTPNRVNPPLTETTTFTIAVNDSIAVASNSNTTVVVESVNDAPSLSGTVAGQAITDKQTTTPFSTTLISDADANQTQLVTVTLSAAGATGTLSGFTAAGSGVYSFSGTASAAQSAIRGLVFTPTQNRVAPGATETTTFTVQVNDGFASVLSDNATTLIVTSVNDAPVVAGAVAGQAITDIQTTTPFSTVTVTDVDNPAQTQLVTVTLDLAAKGSFTTLNGFTDAGGGFYTFSGTAAAVESAVQGLVFTPTPNRVNPPLTETTTFTITVNDSIAAPVSNAVTTVVVTSVNDAPVLSGTVSGQAITDKQTTRPLSTTLISDADVAQTQFVTVTLDTAAKGSFTGLNGFTNAGGGVYTFTGTAGAATTAIQGLVFTPTENRVTPGATEVTTFTVQVNDGFASVLSDNATTLDVLSINDAPVAVDDSVSTNQNASVSINALANDSDVDVQSLSIVAVGPRSLGGDVSISPPGITWTLLYTPTPSVFGTDTFTYTISDGALTDTAQVTVTILALPDLAVAKSDGQDTATNSRDKLFYTIWYTNTGNAPSGSIRITETIPANTKFVAGDSFPTGNWGSCANNDTSGTCVITRQALGIGASSVVTFVVETDRAPSGSTIVNTVLIGDDGANGPELSYDNNSAQDATVVKVPDLVVTKSDGGATGVPGGTVSYTINFTNTGAEKTEGSVITETVPSGTVFNSGASTAGWDCTNLPICRLLVGTGGKNTLDPDASGTATFVVNIPNPVSTGVTVITNTVRIGDDGTKGDDLNLANNIFTDTTPINASPVLTISKSGPSSAVIGQPIVYTLLVTNTGNQIAAGLTITDALPVGSTFVTASDGGVNVGNIVSWTLASLTTNAPVTRQFTVTASATITNSSYRVSAAGGISAVGAVSVTTIATSPVLTITKTVFPSAVIAGNQITYTVRITNSGTAAASNLVVTDSLPLSVSLVTSSTGGLMTCGGTSNLTCNLASLGVGSSVTWTITGTVSASAPSGLVITNRAGVTATGVSSVPIAQVTTTVQRSVALTITKTAFPSTVLAGNQITYTVRITNEGPSLASNLVVTDSLPLSVSLVTSSTGGLMTCGGTSSLTCNLPSLGVGSSVTWTITGTVNPSAPNGLVITNRAGVTATEASSVQIAQVATPVQRSAALTITKTAFPSTVLAGNQITYTVRITNNGPSLASNLVVTDSLPLSVSLVTSSTGGLMTCGGTISLICNLPSLGVGSSVTWTITGTVSASAPDGVPITNTAGVTATEVSAAEIAQVATPVQRSAALTITKTAFPSTVLAGNQITYTVRITNNGPSLASNVQVTDTLPAGMSSVISSTTGGVLSCAGIGNLTCDLPSLGVGSSVTWTITGTVSPSAPDGVPITNTAGVTATGASSVQSAQVATTVGTLADLQITKSEEYTDTIVGAVITYTLHITNTGPSFAQAVYITDTLPVSVAFGSVIDISPANLFGAASSAGGTVTWMTDTLPLLNGGGSIVFTGTITGTGTLINSVAITSTTNDNAPSNNSFATPGFPVLASAGISSVADLWLGVESAPALIAVGGANESIFRAGNWGPLGVADATVTIESADELVVRLLTDPPLACPWRAEKAVCTLPSLPAGGEIAIGVTVPSVSPGPVDSVWTLESERFDPNPENNRLTQRWVVDSGEWRFFLPLLQGQADAERSKAEEHELYLPAVGSP